MLIYLKRNYRNPVPQWGNIADVERAVAINCGEIYRIDPASIVLAMPMWESAGDVVHDYSGRNNHGTNNGATWTSQGLHFDGSNSVSLDIDKLPIVVPITMMALFIADNVTDDHTLISIGNYGAKGFHRLFAGGSGFSDKIVAQTQNDAAVTSQASSTVAFIANKVHLATAVFSSTELRIAYIDKGNAGGDATSIIDPTSDFANIGVLERSTSIQYLTGTMLSADFFNIALTPAQIELRNDLPHALYQPVARTIYSFPEEAPAELFPVTFLRGNYRNRVPQWGNIADVERAVAINCGEIYKVDPASIILAMPMWESAGDVIHDYSGHGVEGTVIGSPPGWVSGGFRLDQGNDEYIDFGTPSDLLSNISEISIVVSFTAYGWGENNFGRLLSFIETVPASYGWEIYLDGGNTAARVGFYGVSDDVTLQSTGSIALNTEHTIVGTCKNGDQRIYDNGIQYDSDTVATGNIGRVTANTMKLGIRPYDDAREFNGVIKSATVYNRVPTPEQVALQYDLPHALYQPVARVSYFFPEEVVVGVAPTGTIYGPLYGPLAGPI